MRIRLPILVHKEHRLLAGLLLFAVAAVLYLTSNHFHIFRPQLLPLSRIDAAVPFVPQTVWLYVSEYLYGVVIYWSYRSEEHTSELQSLRHLVCRLLLE